MSSTDVFKEQLRGILERQVQENGLERTAYTLNIRVKRLTSVLDEGSNITIGLIAAMHAAGWLADLVDSGPSRLGTLFADMRYQPTASVTPGGYVSLRCETAGGRPVELVLSPLLAQAVCFVGNPT